MKVLLDECVPRKLRNYLPGIESQTVSEVGLAGRRNGELLTEAERLGFEVFLTLDRGIEYEQNLQRHNIAVIVLHARSNRLDECCPTLQKFLRCSVRSSAVG